MPASSPATEFVSAGDGLVIRLCQIIAEVQRIDRLAPVTVITPSFYSSFFLRRAVMRAAASWGTAGDGRRGLFNVEFTRIEEAADMLAGPGQGAGQPEKRPLSSLSAGAFVFDAAQMLTDGGALGKARGHPSLHRALHRTLDDLRAAGMSAEDLPRQGGHFAELRKVTGEYERLVRAQGFEDRADVAAGAATRLSQGGLLPRLGTVIVLLAMAPAPQYRVLYRALMTQAGLTTLVCLTGNPAADAPLIAFAGGRAPAANNVEKAGDPPRTVFVSAPGPAAEARWVASNLLRLARHEGLLFSEMAVLYADRSYGPRLEEAFRFAGIPVSGPASSRPADWPEGRFITGLLDALEPDPASGAPSLSRDAVTGWLTAASVRDPATRGPAPSARWDGISRLAGVTGGLQSWEHGLEALRARLERQARRAPLDDEQGEEMAGRSASDQAGSAVALRVFIRSLADKGRAPAPGGWKEYVEWLRGLRSNFQMSAPAGDTAADAASAERRERIDLTLGRLEELGALGLAPPSFDRFSQLLRDELARPAGKSGPLGSGIFLGPYREAAGASFRAVHIAGVAEGQFIAHDSPDPLLPDSDRARLNERRAGHVDGADARGGAALELRSDRRAAQLLELEAAAQSGQLRFFSWPRSQAGAARESGPAEWLVQQARKATANAGLQSQDLKRPDSSLEGVFIWLDRDERVLAPASSSAAQAARDEAGPDSAPDAHWHDVASVAAWARALKYQAHQVVSDPGGPVEPALRLEASRYVQRWTEWDGNLTGNVRQRATAQFQIASPTRYETWAACPFRYFLGYEIEVSPTERPEDLLELTPAERGTLVHAVLEEFVRARMQTPPAAAPDEIKLLDEAASRVFARFAREERTGHPALWEMEKRSLRRSLKVWLSQDADARSRSGAAPWRVELAFGTRTDAAPPVEVGLPAGVRLLFRGKIDRVDLSPDGRVFVYDYKSGSPDRYGKLDKDVTKKGTLLQLPVYALAARKAIEQEGLTARAVSASYWPVLRTVALALRPRPDEFDEQKADERLREVAGVIASGVDAGVFPARPGAQRTARDGVPGSPFENCEYCPFDRVCAAPGRRAWLWERKRGSDPALAPYVRLAEGDDAPDGGEAQA